MLAALLFSAAVSATTTPDPKIDQVDADFRALSRVAALAKDLNDSRQVMLAIVDDDLETLRDRRPDDTYRWASLQREEASRVKDQKTVERVYTEKELREVTITASNAYRLEVSVPTKQGIFAKNNRVYVRNVLVDSTGFDDKIAHHEIAVDAWVNPGDANGTALPEIGKSVKATAELGVESGDKRAVADVALLQAKLVDDPTSPYFPVVQRLLKTREVLTQKDLNRGFLKSTVDEALLSLPGEMEKRTAEETATAERRNRMSGTIAPGDASPDVTAALQEVSRLL
ncbi:MAG TPA: hypothetical protein VL284_01860, partial [Thermoanaerobaculia bacterium]|nr:hypothetical protein [Thermoanaerobaculia bacterium]